MSSTENCFLGSSVESKFARNPATSGAADIVSVHRLHFDHRMKGERSAGLQKEVPLISVVVSPMIGMSTPGA